jgi:hypothetical protein
VFLVAAGATALGFALALAMPDLKLCDRVQSADAQVHVFAPRVGDPAAQISAEHSV